ncbi:MAG: fimbrillin family protein [Bacteroides sp.]|nr:fimbrillin family protein [Bacteroides sp.]
MDVCPTQYWEEGAKHTFLAYSPYNAGYWASDGLLRGVVIAAAATEQQDLLYSLPEAGGSKDLEWVDAGTKVVVTFRHALSQIRLSASTDQDYSGYYTATITKIQLKGVNNAGTLNLNATPDAASLWSEQGMAGTSGGTTGSEGETEVSSAYVATAENLSLAPLGTAETLLNAGDNLFMQMPQEIANGETATFELTCRIEATAAGNTANDGEKVFTVKIPAVTWEHNRIYHYKIQMDLQQLLGLKPIEVGDPDVVEWEMGTETKLLEDLTVVIEPTNDTDTKQTGKGNAELGITKANTADQTQTVRIINPEKGDQWIVEVSPELADTGTPAALNTRVAPNTRAEKEPPASWLKVCEVGPDGTAGSELNKLYGKEDATILIKITEANGATKPRQAEVAIRRALSGVTRILVT